MRSNFKDSVVVVPGFIPNVPLIQDVLEDMGLATQPSRVDNSVSVSVESKEVMGETQMEMEYSMQDSALWENQELLEDSELGYSVSPAKKGRLVSMRKAGNRVVGYLATQVREVVQEPVWKVYPADWESTEEEEEY